MASLSTGERSGTCVGVGEALDGVSEAVGDDKIGGNGVEGTFNKDVNNDGMTFRGTQTNRHALEPNV